MRKRFISWLVKKASLNEKIILLTGDLGYSVLEPFADKFPERFINVGVAEQNMIGIASGLASEGFLPYLYSIGIFPTFRCAEQLRNDVDYHKLPVVTCTVGSGVAYGNLGYSHHAIQDLGLMRLLPNTIISTPSDPLEVEKILDFHLLNPSPMYLRMHKAGEPVLHSNLDKILPGELYSLYKPKNKKDLYSEVCIIVCGYISFEVINIMKKLNINIPVYSLPMWGQSVSSDLVKKINKFKNIITVEDHLIEGGLGSFLMEICSQNDIKTKIKSFGIDSSLVFSVAKESSIISKTLMNFEKFIIQYK